MSPLEYLTESLPWWHQYLLLLAIFLLVHLPIIRHWVVGIYDPLFIVLLANAFGWTIVWFMYLRGDIERVYVASFTVAQIAFYGGIWAGRAFRPKRNFLTRVPAEPAVASLAFSVAAVVYTASTLVIWQIAGIPLLRDSRLGAFEGSGGLGILERLAESSALIAVFSVVYLMVHRGRLRRSLLLWGFLIWYVATIALSGSKAAVLSLGQQILSILFVYTALRASNERYWGGRAGKLLLVASTLFAIAVLATQQEGDLVSAAVAFGYRIVSYGDVYIFAYPYGTIESVQGNNPFVGMLGGFLSTFRLFPQELVYPNIGYQFTNIVFPDLDLIVGPNPQHAIFGYHYFGGFGFIFSFSLGLLTAMAQSRLYRRRHTSFLGGMFAFIVYFTLVGISVDFEYTMSKLASIVIGLLIVGLPVLAVLPRTPILRIYRRWQSSAGSPLRGA